MSNQKRMEVRRVSRRRRLHSFAAVALAAACSSTPARSESVETQEPPSAAQAAAEPAIPPLEVDSAGAEWVERTLAGLSLRQRVAQLVFPWISGASADAQPAEYERMLAWAARDQVGGLIVSTGTPQTLAAKLNAAQARAALPLLIVSDLETGPGMRLTPGGTRMPPAMAFGAAGDTALSRQAGLATAQEARAVGIHATLGPVLDVNSNPANPIINVRSFGAAPDAVATLASAWVRGAHEGGLLTIGKHFPGHGDTQVDSHVGLAAIAADSARLDTLELVPFRAAARAGMDGILVGHIAVQGMEGPDAPPASLSPRITGGVLRQGMGFRGLVFTDALNMGGVTRAYSVTEASIRALLAGADALLQPPGHPAVIDGIVAAVESGRIPRARVDEAARRVLTAKAAAGLHRSVRIDPAAVSRQVGTEAHRAVAAQVAERSITLARNTGGIVPLRRGTRVLHVTYASPGRAGAGGTLNRVLSAGGLDVDQVRVGAGTSASTYASLRTRAASADVVIASAAVVPVQYQSLGIDGGFGAFVEQVSATRPVVAVALGSPYILGSFPSVPAYLLAWDSGAASEDAAARALLGRIPITGRLPVPLAPYYRLGEGIILGR